MGAVIKHHWKIPKHCSIEQLGFVYAITNNITGQIYYGRKQFLKFRRRKALIDESWRTYTGSSLLLSKDIQRYGKRNFTFDMIATFGSKTGMAVAESVAIICSGALEHPESYYNRAAPSIRGKLSLTEYDIESLKMLRKYIGTKSKEVCMGKAKTTEDITEKPKKRKAKDASPKVCYVCNGAGIVAGVECYKCEGFGIIEDTE